MGQPNDQKVGTFGDIATLSFYPAHHITMGESGLVSRIMMNLSQWSPSETGDEIVIANWEDNTATNDFVGSWETFHLVDHKYTYSHMGYNLKISDMQAAWLSRNDGTEGFSIRN